MFLHLKGYFRFLTCECYRPTCCHLMRRRSEFVENLIKPQSGGRLTGSPTLRLLLADCSAEQTVTNLTSSYETLLGTCFCYWVGPSSAFRAASNTLWPGFNKVSETLLRHSGPY
ncbi:hypothetical protein GOODEAATRI_019538 [Goodea atripinnis]|uniref:Uncharacterized protein n=1 Tax=Goodea atripinnis TaxID=208336 RepID=A0ABV0P676_9TELE